MAEIGTTVSGWLREAGQTGRLLGLVPPRFSYQASKAGRYLKWHKELTK